MKNHVIVEISPKTTIFIILAAATLFLVSQVIEVVMLLFVSFILSSALGPTLDHLVKKRVPKTLAIALVYLTFFALVALVILSVVPPVIDQTQRFVQNLPQITESSIRFFTEVFPYLKDKVDANQIGAQISALLAGTIDGSNIGGILTGIGSLFGTVANAFFSITIIMVMTGFFLGERGKVTKEKQIIKKILGEKSKRFMRIYNEVQLKLGFWLRGQLILAFMSGVFNFLVFTILGIQFAAPIGIFAAAMEFIPNIGATILTPVAFLIAIGTGADPVVAVAYVIIIGIYQQLQGALVVPKIMQKAVGVNPLIIIVSVLVGTHLVGFVGALVAIPVAAILQIVVEDYVQHLEIRKTRRVAASTKE